jgi:GNAT superfamily N-acetyltransferase
MHQPNFPYAFSWESQEMQYPDSGPEGITYFAGEVPDAPPVDCLLYRNRFGKLIGILNHYSVDYPPWEKAGNFAVWIHPAYRRQGIATSLFEEAERRWNVRLDGQLYSIAGAQWANAIESKREGTA